MTEAFFLYPCGVWEASKPRVASPHFPQPSGEWTAELKVCVRHNTEALKLSQDKSAEKFPSFYKRAQFNIVCGGHARVRQQMRMTMSPHSLLQVSARFVPGVRGFKKCFSWPHQQNLGLIIVLLCCTHWNTLCILTLTARVKQSILCILEWSWNKVVVQHKSTQSQRGHSYLTPDWLLHLNYYTVFLHFLFFLVSKWYFYF